MSARPDTFERSCQHWSEAGRDGMEAFYELARVDYRHLALAWDWSSAFRSLAAGGKRVRLVDVACGSGKFPEALLRHAGLSRLEGLEVDYDLLDPSDFSLREARRVLAPPFRAAEEFCCTLQDWKSDAGLHDVAWATHALYCVPVEELDASLDRMARALSPAGLGFVAQGLREGHYVGFYDRYRESFLGGGGTPYSDGAQVGAALRRLGLVLRTRELAYTTVVPAGRRELLEAYLQRCAFDDSVGLDDMLRTEPLAGYLAGCRDGAGTYRFPQRVAMTVFAHRESGVARLPDGATEALA